MHPTIASRQACYIAYQYPIGHGNQMHARTKHFDIRLYFLRDTIENKKIILEYLPTKQMVADILTKGLPSPHTQVLSQKLGIY